MFPMYVGMNRREEQSLDYSTYVPHVCGDEPAMCKAAPAKRKCSPCMWG